MTEPLALVGEEDRSRLRSITKTLQRAGYRVRACASAAKLNAELYARDTVASGHLLIMVAPELALVCASAILTLADTRWLAQLSQPVVVFACRSHPILQALPRLDGCEVAVIVVDTFDSSDPKEVSEGTPFFIRIGETRAHES